MEKDNDTATRYASFTQVKRVANRQPEDIHTLQLVHDARRGTLEWYVEQELVFSNPTPGIPLPQEHGVVTILDHGGTVPSQPVVPRALFAGWGQMTVLDVVDPHNPQSTMGLVQLSDTPNFYVTPQGFADTQSLESSRLFGQGASATVFQFSVEKVEES